MSVVNLREAGPNSQAETAVLDRLDRWRNHFGPPLVGGRANPDNDLTYLLMDAAECIRGLRLYARKLERSQEDQP